MSFNGYLKVDAFGVLNAGIKKELNRQHGTLQLSVSDLFRSAVVSSYFGALTKEAFDLTTNVKYHNESSDYLLIKVTYTRSFGSGNKNQRNNGGLQSERDRVN